MPHIQDVLYTGRTHTISGRDGSARSDDGRLDVKLTRPGSQGAGTNPEQLLGAGWSACFLGAMGRAAAARRMTVPANATIDAEVDLGQTDGQFFLAARLNISLPGVDPALARELAEAAHQICPYSKATRGNIDVELNIV
ncbi:Ohr family peroxiredoxin [Piscinibacter terrae]|uniref:Ohr family peroxiredoxin n=1 Tax=Piscinibacter terrae TaxID=2496871 RepID=A0A3N7HUA3_9BURK|nr:Ohr family peroxiredoxin [Albitalea terrae]RQP25890.1 Ohr family peroxiredoxin [Albitalea terrae]